MGLHRERQCGKSRLQKRCVIVMEAAASVDRERIDYTRSLRRVAAIAKYEELPVIISRSLSKELLKRQEVALLWTELKPSAHPRAVFTSAGSTYEVIHRAP